MKTDETEYDNSGIQGLEIKDENWIEDIKMVFNEIDFKYPFPDPDTELFYTIIWNKSLEAFDSPREVQVIVDAGWFSSSGHFPVTRSTANGGQVTFTNNRSSNVTVTSLIIRSA